MRNQLQGHQGCDCDRGGGCDCGCGGEGRGSGAHFARRYETREEQISSLEAYLGELRQELKAVEEQIADLRK